MSSDGDLKTAALHVALAVSDGQLKSLRSTSQPGAELHIPRYVIEGLIATLDELYPGVIDRARQHVRELSAHRALGIDTQVIES